MMPQLQGARLGMGKGTGMDGPASEQRQAAD